MTTPRSCRTTLPVDGKSYVIWSLPTFAAQAKIDIQRLPFSIKVLLENVLRNEDGRFVKAEDILAVASTKTVRGSDREVAFTPARVLMQDFTGVPAVVDLAAMRDAMAALGGDAQKINPLVPVDLVIDHSIMVDQFGSASALAENTALEYQRNRERYEFLRWGQKAFRNFRVVPPGAGICHQVNLEYLASVVMTRTVAGETWAFPDTLVGTDSHTVMINGLGVLGWGVGGIEAEAAMLGQPLTMLIPDVVGFKMTGRLPAGATATDAVLTVTQMLRKKGVVGKFVEFYGPGLGSLSLADRATIANMAPEYGATMGFFPIDVQTMRYLELTNRPPELLRLVEAYAKAQGLYRTSDTPDPLFDDTIELDLSTVVPCLAGPKRPQDRVELSRAASAWKEALPGFLEKKSKTGEITRIPSDVQVPVHTTTGDSEVHHGSVVIAAITSCTNTSNPSVMLGAGLLAQKAVQAGLKRFPTVKTSLAPGSKVVMAYLEAAGVLPALETLGFNLVGYGCTTCIGNSGPLPEAISKAVKDNNIVAAAVLSGNRNFEGRVNPQVKANYLASPPLVVAYAIAGRMNWDPLNDPIGHSAQGKPIFLKDLWPTPEEVDAAVRKVSRTFFEKEYAVVFQGDAQWQSLPAAVSERYPWDAKSTYIKNPPYFVGMSKTATARQNIAQARVLAWLGDSVTTDHISPAGSIAKDGPAGRYLGGRAIDVKDFNSYGARRGHDEVMVRGTFANIRLKNLLAPGTEGGWTTHFPDKVVTSIFEASEQYRAAGIPTIVIAGKEYGSGSSRDWAAKGPALLGIQAVIAESYERIHRSNLVGMGVAPLQFKPGETPSTYGLTGDEVYSIDGLAGTLKPKQTVRVHVQSARGTQSFDAILRIDTPEEIAYYQNGGILPYVLRQLLKS